jgi:SAM-dependent methyltransferase
VRRSESRGGLRPWSPALTLNAWLRWEAVDRLLPPRARDVLEVGCGQGAFGVRLSWRYRYLGIEPDARSFAVARARLAKEGGDGAVRNGDLSILAPEEMFDVVCAFEVIEHIDDDRAAIAAWIGRLRPEGRLIVSAPAWQHRFAAADEMVGHFRRYDPSDLRCLLSDAGLEDVEIVRFGAPLGFALEALRNAMGRRRRLRTADESRETRTAASGRLLQPSDGVVAFVVYLVVLPFRKLQRAFPNRGPGVIGVGRRPAP